MHRAINADYCNKQAFSGDDRTLYPVVLEWISRISTVADTTQIHAHIDRGTDRQTATPAGEHTDAHVASVAACMCVLQSQLSSVKTDSVSYSNSIGSICCRSVVRLVVQQIHNESIDGD